jgi:hypothetical protein
MGTSKRYSEEVRERAVRMVAEHLHEYSSQWAAITSIAAKIGCTAESLRRWVHGSAWTCNECQKCRFGKRLRPQCGHFGRGVHAIET